MNLFYIDNDHEIKRLEEYSINILPFLQSYAYDGYTKRANSINILTHSPIAPEKTFISRGVQAILYKIPPLFDHITGERVDFFI